MSVGAIIKKTIGGERLCARDAITLLESNDLVAIGAGAHQRRLCKTDPAVVTYIVDRNINYTNVCTSGCLFCAFYRVEGDTDAWVITDAEIDQKIEETKARGGNQILMQGGLHPSLPFDWYLSLLRRIKKKYGVHIHAFSGPEIVHFAALFGLPIRAVIGRLKEAGLDSIPGGGAEVLATRVRNKISPNKCSADEWIEVMRQAHSLGMRSTATMMFGHEETLAERVESLRRIRDLQDETGGFTAFIPWPFQPDHTAMIDSEKTGGFGYLKTLAVSRLFLDNIDNIQASWVTQGSKIAQLSLLMGANDMGSTMIEENVVAAAGVVFRLPEKELRRIVMVAGFRPEKRLMDYQRVGSKT